MGKNTGYRWGFTCKFRGGVDNNKILGGISIFIDCVKDGRSMNETKDRWPSTDVWRILIATEIDSRYGEVRNDT